MTFVGFNFTKIEGQKSGDFISNTSAKRDIKISDISKEKLPIGEADSVLKFTFSFRVDYENVGYFNLEGYVLYMDDPKEIDVILKGWKEKANINPQLMVQVLNNVLFKCHVKALNLAQDLSLPPHIGLPYVKEESNTSSKKEKKS